MSALKQKDILEGKEITKEFEPLDDMSKTLVLNYLGALRDYQRATGNKKTSGRKRVRR